MLGVWLMAAPAVLGYGAAAATSDRVAGPIIASVSLVAASAIARGLRWLNLLPAAWLLGFPTDALVSSVAVGGVVALLTPLGRADPDRYGGGWRALFDTKRLAR